MKITVYRTSHQLFSYDEKSRMQGEYKFWLENGTLVKSGFYKDNMLHGEYKEWNRNNILIIHKLFAKGQCISDDIQSLSTEDKLLLTLKHNLQWLE